MDSQRSETTLPEYPLRSIYFYLTRSCNLRCRHCWISPQFQEERQSHPSLHANLFKSIVDQGKPLGLNNVKLTGGEPLIHPAISEIIAYIRDSGLGLTMETNGTVITRELALAMTECKSQFVSVSLDGADAETHEWMRGVEGCFEAAVRGIRILVELGIRPQIIMSLVRQNKDQIEPVVRLAESLGASSVKFNLVQPTARGEQMHSDGQTLLVHELVQIGRWVDTELSKSSNIRLIYSTPAAFRSLSSMFGPCGDGCHTCGIRGIIGVLADGSYALCGIGETVPELVFGSAATDSLEDVWLNSPLLQEIREGLPKRLSGVCSKCLMKKICLGECIAQNYYSTKDLWSPFWYCEAAFKQGIFPESRLKT
jgi:SynChlorMet cassette radical SAM/SPASM protein ScmF